MEYKLLMLCRDPDTEESVLAEAPKDIYPIPAKGETVGVRTFDNKELVLEVLDTLPYAEPNTVRFVMACYGLIREGAVLPKVVYRIKKEPIIWARWEVGDDEIY